MLSEIGGIQSDQDNRSDIQQNLIGQSLLSANTNLKKEKKRKTKVGKKADPNQLDLTFVEDIESI